MYIFAVCSYILPLSYATASPVLSSIPLLQRAPNSTVDTQSAWVSEPDGRGSYDILYSCFTTLSLCAWTAFHPNIPCKEGDVRFTFQRLRWMLVAVFFPEAVLYCALDQWLAARHLKDEVNRLGRQEKARTLAKEFLSSDENACDVCSTTLGLAVSLGGPNGREDVTDLVAGREDHNMITDQNPASQNDQTITSAAEANTQIAGKQRNASEKSKAFIPWTTEQAFFVISGGVAVDTSHFWNKPLLTYTPEGIVLLAEIGLLPRLSKADVEARSKADIIAKLLVCTQTIWFLIQCFARIATRLPLTLLEVHTMTHIACALVMYTAWFKKVYTASRPMLCKDPRVVNMAALLALRNEINDSVVWGDNIWVLYRKDDTVEYEDVELEIQRRGLEVVRYSHHNSCSMQHDLDIEAVRWRHGDPAETSKIPAHFEAANNAIKYLRDNEFHFTWDLVNHQNGHWIEYFEKQNFVVHSLTNRRIKGRYNGSTNHKKSHGFRRYAALVISCLYGASHLSAWAFRFPTRIEMWMWRASCISMVGVPILAGILFLVRGAESRLRRVGRHAAPEKGRIGRRRQNFGIVLVAFVCLDGIFVAAVLVNVYPFIRVFLLAESLASLRSPANGTYDSVDWTFVIPHAS
ncbi:hypothetical protein MMC28_003554 [Mycoblastus sanguinarius]|nr:hypothetical protein [Mycoblastus sanguinarius]